MNTDFGEDWEGFWRTSQDLAAYRSGGPQQDVLDSFWSGFLRGMLARFTRPRLLDLACGNGVIARSALETANQVGLDGLDIVGLDQSIAGLRDLRRRTEMVHALAANAAALPLRSGSFDLVVSQFGVEYASQESYSEVVRVLATGGVFAAVLHLREGAIFQECQLNLAAVLAVESCEFLGRARLLFLHRQQSASSRQANHTAQLESDFQNSCSLMVEILKSNPEGVAGGVVRRLYTDVTRMVRSPAGFDTDPVLAWMDGMAQELRSYCGRMNSMMEASLSKQEFDQVVRALELNSMTIRVQEAMHMGLDNRPAAWVLVSEKSNT